MASSSRRQRSTLAVFIQALEGSKIVVELKNDAVVRGTLASADATLGLQLSDASVKALDGTQRHADVLHLRGSSVRYIHLPANLDPAAAIEARRKRAALALRQHAAAQGNAQRLAKGQDMEFNA
jgi:U6 snRNA-associated Sm-like protein LSm2